MPREKAQVAQTARPKVPMRWLGADCFVVVLKRGNARGAKGAGHRHLARVNRQREEPDFNGRRQHSRGGTSRMMREYQVRFCERLGVKFPGPTRQKHALPHCNSNGRFTSISGHKVDVLIAHRLPTPSGETALGPAMTQCRPA